MRDTAISFENVSKSYPLYHHITGGFKSFLLNLPSGAAEIFRKNRHEVLEDISFTVRIGESFGIVGKNGAGKSTALGLIAGVLRPSGGRVVVNGRISPLLELGGGFHQELSGRENILLNGVLLGMTQREVKDRMDEVIDFSELSDFIDQPIRTYSSGMLARLGFSVVAHLEPEILLIDEVLSVGDIGFQAKCDRKIQEFRDGGVTLVMVTHSIEAIGSLCDRALWIDDKRVRLIGPAREVAKEYGAA